MPTKYHTHQLTHSTSQLNPNQHPIPVQVADRQLVDFPVSTLLLKHMCGLMQSSAKSINEDPINGPAKGGLGSPGRTSPGRSLFAASPVSPNIPGQSSPKSPSSAQKYKPTSAGPGTDTHTNALVDVEEAETEEEERKKAELDQVEAILREMKNLDPELYVNVIILILLKLYACSSKECAIRTISNTNNKQHHSNTTNTLSIYIQSILMSTDSSPCAGC